MLISHSVYVFLEFKKPRLSFRQALYKYSLRGFSRILAADSQSLIHILFETTYIHFPYIA